MQLVGFAQAAPVPELIDPFGRQVTYLRISVTDRCDFRCVYCMAENMTFLPKKEILTLEEIDFGSTRATTLRNCAGWFLIVASIAAIPCFSQAACRSSMNASPSLFLDPFGRPGLPGLNWC